MKLGKNLSGSSFFAFMGDRVIFVYQGFTMFLEYLQRLLMKCVQ